MKEHRIERAEVFVVGPDVERYTWAEGMTRPVHGQRHPAAHGGERPARHRRRGDDHLARLRPLRRRDAAHCAARRHRPEPGGARGALAPHAQSRHADGAAGAVADRHRAVGHGGAARRAAALPAPRRRARKDPLLCLDAAARRQPGLYRLCRRAAGGRLQGGQIPLLVRAGARSADVRGGAPAFRGQRTSR